MIISASVSDVYIYVFFFKQKTAYEMRISDWSSDVCSSDLATIYRGMDIGTAKPSRSEQATMPHHLLDIRDPAESYSAAEFQRDASLLIHQIQDRSEEHTSELQSLMRNSSAVFCLKKKTQKKIYTQQVSTKFTPNNIRRT